MGTESASRSRAADLIISGCGLAGVTAAAGALLPWTGATLSDRGAVLLPVSRSGVELSSNGMVVLVLGVVCAVSSVVPRDSRWARPLTLVLAPAGLAIAVLAAVTINAGDSVAAELLRLRIGTFQTDHPVAAAQVGPGLWLSLGAGGALILGGVGWQLVGRSTRESSDHNRSHLSRTGRSWWRSPRPRWVRASRNGM
ncbi:hypothetical protein [Frankia sp. Cr1]|uniref:hypothetical protein n=1 Tax=Frankia sp. Cr1 TaxID=3073931 RepID=UPI002AD35C7F|nr:hypothetical protein [Frankia sp. Cr1]